MPVPTDDRDVWPIDSLKQPCDIPLRKRSTGPFLWPGARFHGVQRDIREHRVQLEIKDVDLDRGFVCGYMTSHDLAESLPVFTTYFEGEIISPHYSFRTKHEDWGTTWSSDLARWLRFPSFRRLEGATSESFVHKDFKTYQCLFMRLKELFPVPDHQLQIRGASYKGFYYVCLDQLMGFVLGSYFEQSQSPLQGDEYIELEPDIDSLSVRSSFEFI